MREYLINISNDKLPIHKEILSTFKNISKEEVYHLQFQNNGRTSITLRYGNRDIISNILSKIKDVECVEQMNKDLYCLIQECVSLKKGHLKGEVLGVEITVSGNMFIGNQQN